jgi:hypothetical protein
MGVAGIVLPACCLVLLWAQVGMLPTWHAVLRGRAPLEHNFCPHVCGTQPHDPYQYVIADSC